VNGDIINPIALTSPIVFDFKDDSLIVSKNINPPIDRIKNDFTVWRKRAGANGGQLDIHARYAIDQKPPKYTRSENNSYSPLKNVYVFDQYRKIDDNFYLNLQNGEVCSYKD
jgi:hypothetical protein